MAKKSKSAKKSEAAPKAKTKAPGKGAWRLMDRGSSIAAGLLAQRASVLAWRAVTGKKPPTSGRHPEVSTGEAVAWAVVGGALIELVKVGVRRGTANYWVKSTGQLPPGMKPLASSAQTKTSQTKTSQGKTREPVPEEPAPSLASTKKFSRRSRGR